MPHEVEQRVAEAPHEGHPDAPEEGRETGRGHPLVGGGPQEVQQEGPVASGELPLLLGGEVGGRPHVELQAGGRGGNW